VTGARPPWRLLAHPPADGAWNMAVDEALLDAYAGDAAPVSPTLRLYAWRPAALSLGRFQAASGSHDPHYLRGEGLDLVRRPTGGTAVLHEFERTYAVVARLRAAPFSGRVLDTYRRVAEALCVALRSLGLGAVAHEPDRKRARPRREVACFAAPSAYEIAVGSRKLVGSAQLRRRGAFLQHGSILLRSDPGRLGRALGIGQPPGSHTDLRRALGAEVDLATLDRALVGAFERAFSAALTPGRLGARERERATRLRSWKYLSAEWTLQGRLPRGTVPD